MADLTVTTASIAGAVGAAVLWLAWALCSETRHNHGFWVAFLMPLAPVIIPFLWILYVSIKYSSYLGFLLLGRREDHREFMGKVRVRSGVFLFFDHT
jgi:hypothetical protein